MKSIVSKYRLSDFYFYDTDFFGPGKKNRRRAGDFAHLVIEEGLSVNFFLYTRATDFDDETLSLLKEAGLDSVFIGIESFSQAVLDRYNKATKVSDNYAAIELCKKYDIYIQYGYITYDYYTTFDELRDTVNGWRRVLRDKPHLFPTPQFLFTLIAPLDETPIGDHYVDSGIVDQKAKYSFPSWIIPDLRMKSPIGPYKFRDPRVGKLAECTRILAYELAKKIVKVNHELAAEIETCSSDEELASNVHIQSLVGWVSKLSPFAIDVFDSAVNAMEQGQDIYDTIEGLYKKCLSYYQAELPIGAQDLETYEHHYMKLRARSSGFVEAKWEQLLSQSTT